MKNKDMNHGIIINLEPLVYADTCVFFPRSFSEKKEKQPAKIIVKDYSLCCNIDTRLLFQTDTGIREMALPFEEKDDSYEIDILEFFESHNIPYTLGDGVYCDGWPYNQHDASSMALYDKNAMIEKSLSPYWGLQMELNIVNKKLRPNLNGREVKMIRFNNCPEEKQFKIVEWFKGLVDGSIQIDPYELDKVIQENLRQINPTSCALFCKTENGYDWEYYC